jgi:DNA recombination protein RmuC
VTVESVLLGLVLLLVLAVLAVLLIRRPVSDPTLPLLQAAQERQGERLGALTGEVKAALTASEAALGAVVQGFAVEQAKLLNAALLKQTEALAAMEKSLLDRFAAEAKATQEGLSAGMLKQAESLANTEKSLLERLTADAKATQEAMSAETARSREVLDKKLTEMRETSEKRLAEIQKSVNEQLAGAVEKQMNESFARVIDQFTAVQKAMGEIQAVTGQIGDIKRLFGNVKTRGGWGETQVKAVLDDILPEGSYEVNVRLREGSADSVEFCVVMPTTGEARVLLPVDAKFPVEDYDRLVIAWEAADAVAEAAARKALEIRIRGEAKKIAEKYILPPRTVEFAVLYLPTEGLYAEVARIPGLIDDIGRNHRVLILGPSLLPALLRTIQLGHVTLALSKNAESVRELLAATKDEMGKMDGVLKTLSGQVGNVANTISKAQVRTRAIARKLRGVDVMAGQDSGAILGIADDGDEDDEA